MKLTTCPSCSGSGASSRVIGPTTPSMPVAITGAIVRSPEMPCGTCGGSGFVKIETEKKPVNAGDLFAMPKFVG